MHRLPLRVPVARFFQCSSFNRAIIRTRLFTAPSKISRPSVRYFAAPAAKKDEEAKNVVVDEQAAAKKDLMGNFYDTDQPFLSPYNDDQQIGKPIPFQVDWPPTYQQVRGTRARRVAVLFEGSAEAFFHQYVWRTPGIVEPDTTFTTHPKFWYPPATLEEARERNEPIRAFLAPYQDLKYIKTPKPYYVLESFYRESHRGTHFGRSIGMFGKYSWWPLAILALYLLIGTEFFWNNEIGVEYGLWILPAFFTSVPLYFILSGRMAYKPIPGMLRFKNEFCGYRMDTIKRYILLEEFNITHPADVQLLMGESKRINDLSRYLTELKARLEQRKGILQKLNAIYSLEQEQESLKRDAQMRGIDQFIRHTFPKLQKQARDDVLEAAIATYGNTSSTERAQNLKKIRSTVRKLSATFFDMNLTPEQLGVEDRVGKLLETEPEAVRKVVAEALAQQATELRAVSQAMSNEADKYDDEEEEEGQEEKKA